MTTPSTPPPSGPPWVEILVSVIGVLGGAGGITAIATVLLQRRKFKADAADVLTDTALILAQPLKARVAELEAETVRARRQVEAATREISELRSVVREATAMIRRWRTAILAPSATIDQLRVLVSSSSAPERLPGDGPWADDVPRPR